MMLAEGAGVDASKHNLFGACCRNLSCHVDGFGHGGTARATAGEGDGAVGAEVVATILHLEEGAGAVGVRKRELETFGLGLGSVYVLFLSGEHLFHMVKQIVLLVIAEDDVDAFDFLDFSCRILGKAADDGHNGIGVEHRGLADGVAAFLLGDGGDGAGVDDVEVGLLVEINRFPSCIVEFAEQVRGFCKIKFASQCVCGDGFHVRCMCLLLSYFCWETRFFVFSYLFCMEAYFFSSMF